MRRQWPCSKCGFACPSTWGNLHPYKPVLCNTCKSNDGKDKAISDPLPKQILNNNGAKSNLSKSTTFDQISTAPSSSVMHENMALKVNQFKMIFGNLPFEPTFANHEIVHEDQLHEKNSEVGEDIKCGTSLKILESGMVHEIKKEYDYDQEQDQANPSTIWDPSKVQKKRRSNLPQYTLSPLARFVTQLQLHHISLFHRNTVPQDLKYDDVLIYKKCNKFVAENEVGLGAVMLSPLFSADFYQSMANYSASTEEEMSSSADDESDAYSNCLVDVPIRNGLCD